MRRAPRGVDVSSFGYDVRTMFASWLFNPRYDYIFENMRKRQEEEAEAAAAAAEEEEEEEEEVIVLDHTDDEHEDDDEGEDSDEEEETEGVSESARDRDARARLAWEHRNVPRWLRSAADLEEEGEFDPAALAAEFEVSRPEGMRRSSKWKRIGHGGVVVRMPNGSVRRLFVVEPWATVLGSESASSSDLSFCVDELDEDDDEVWGGGVDPSSSSSSSSSLSGGGVGSVRCPHCGKRLSRAGYLRTHIRTVHEGDRGFECKVCHRRFGQKGNLRSHIRTVHEGDRGFECEVCHRRFGASSDLRRHEQALGHVPDHPHVCDVCDARFPSLDGLHKHQGRKHPPPHPPSSSSS